MLDFIQSLKHFEPLLINFRVFLWTKKLRMDADEEDVEQKKKKKDAYIDVHIDGFQPIPRDSKRTDHEC